MELFIGPYKNWFGPYEIADLLKYVGVSEKRREEIGAALPEWVTTVCRWVESKRTRKVKIKIDRWDTWNMNSTLAMIILPMLKQLKETKQGSPLVDIEDVPEHLRFNGTSQNEDMQLHLDFGTEVTEKFEKDAWEAMHTRWNWVLDEMIWTFEQLQPDYDWELQYTSGVIDYDWVKIEGSGYSEMVKGPCHTYKVDDEGVRKHSDRIHNGLRLFGTYYRGLWD